MQDADQEVIVICNGKGGSGKSPTSVHLFYRSAGKSLYIDADPQATGSLHLIGARHQYVEPNFHDAIIKHIRVEPIQLDRKNHLFVLSSHDGLSDAEDELTKNPTKPFQWRLRKLLADHYRDFRRVIIDTPGSHVSVFTIMALAAASKVVVPVKTEIAHQQATLHTMRLIEDVKENLNPSLVVWGLFPNQFEQNRPHKDALELLSEMKDRNGKAYPIYPEPSLKRTRYNDATAMHVDVSEFADTLNLGPYWDRVAASIFQEKERREG